MKRYLENHLNSVMLELNYMQMNDDKFYYPALYLNYVTLPNSSQCHSKYQECYFLNL